MENVQNATVRSKEFGNKEEAMSTRESAVAGAFYPADRENIEKMFAHFNSVLESHLKDKNLLKLKSRAIIVPHAGYIYSGFTANVAYRLLKNSDVKKVVVIGPSHRVYLEGVSISDYDSFHTPMGKIPIDRELVAKLKAKFHLRLHEEAHHEHSTEVQVPFLQEYLPNITIVELVYGKEDPKHLAQIIEYLLEDPTIGIVISTDLSHYYSLEEAKRLDSICLEAVANEDVTLLHKGCEACGKIGVEAMLIAAKAKGLKPLILDYRTSADASGDKSQVVGYMSAAFLEE